MQPILQGTIIGMKLNQAERRRLLSVASDCDILTAIAPDLVKGLAPQLRAIAEADLVISNGQSKDDLVAADAAETVTEQSPS